MQADPIRAPARAQDLILRHRVAGYRAGDLERRYRALDVEEDFFVNYGFLPRRGPGADASARRLRRLAVARRPDRRAGCWPSCASAGPVHPRDVDAHFAHGAVRNYWGGSSTATTHALDHLHYRGLLRVHGREGGIRLYAAHDHGPRGDPPGRAPGPARRPGRRRWCSVYAPLPAATLSWLVRRLRYAAPQWQSSADARAGARQGPRSRTRTSTACTGTGRPARRCPASDAPDAVRLLAPFDPVVWDRRRFELLWGWAYRFEAYTPEAKRKLGYYALPLLWRDRVIGWANVTAAGGVVQARFGYATGRPPRDRGFAAALEAELEAMRAFLGPARGTTQDRRRAAHGGAELRPTSNRKRASAAALRSWLPPPASPCRSAWPGRR